MRRSIGIIAPLLAAGLTACASQAAVSKPAATPARPVAEVGQGPAIPQPSTAPTAPALLGPGTVANELADVEEAIRQPNVPDPAYVLLGQRQQKAYHLLEAHPDWTPAVLDALPPSLQPVIQANLGAAQQIGTLNGVSASLPHWRIIAPATPETLLSYYREAQQTYGVAWQYLAAINLIETNMGRIQGLSSAGAQGPMQFMPATWAYYGQGDVNNPHDAIRAAGRYLQAHGAPENMTRAIYAYNPSMLYVRAVQLYAQQMFDNAKTFLAYYNWQVYVPTANGDVLLPEGFTG